MAANARTATEKHDYTALTELGATAAANADYEQALQYYSQALSLRPGECAVRLYCGLNAARLSRIDNGKLYSRMDESLAALREVTQVCKAVPPDTAALTQIQRALDELDAFNESFARMGLDFFRMNACTERTAGLLWEILLQAADCQCAVVECRNSARETQNPADTDSGEQKSLAVLRGIYAELLQERAYEESRNGSMLYKQKTLVFPDADSIRRKKEDVDARLTDKIEPPPQPPANPAVRRNRVFTALLAVLSLCCLCLSAAALAKYSRTGLCVAAVLSSLPVLLLCSLPLPAAFCRRKTDARSLRLCLIPLLTSLLALALGVAALSLRLL